MYAQVLVNGKPRDEEQEGHTSLTGESHFLNWRGDG